MKWFRDGKWITGGFIASLLVTGLMSYTSYQNSVELVNSARQAQQTNEILDALTDISALLADAESRQWNYILFNDPDELARYQTTVARLQIVLEQLRQPLGDTEIQQQRLSELDALIQERLRLFAEAIVVYSDEGRFPAATDPLLTRARSNLIQIRQITTELEEKEEDLIADKIASVSASSRLRMLIEPVGTLLTFSILLGVFGLLYRQLQQRQRAEAAQKALAQEKELGELKLQLFSMVSHEFRTPLSLIMGSSQLMETSLKDIVEPSHLKSVYRIQSAAKVMTQLLNDILMISRADAGALEFNPKSIEIQTFCLNLIEEFQVSHACQQTLTFEQKGDRTHAIVDEKLLYSILSNLLSNAAKFSPPDSIIRITMNSQAEALTFQIQDQGIGIAEADISYFYEPFIRGKNVAGIKGTGLGLAVVQRCVALHQGTIHLKRQTDCGTTFIVTIPQDPFPSLFSRVTPG
jgi:signal transduction histidine kinase